MQDNTRIPRWLVESDPSWERSIDSSVGMLKWTKKGTGVQATCSPTSMFCEVIGHDDAQAGLADIGAGVAKMGKQTNLSDDITKYLSSRYLNPGVNGLRHDLRKMRKF